MPYEDWHDLQGYYRDSTRLHAWIGALPDLDIETCHSQPPKPEPVESARSDSGSQREEKSPPLRSPAILPVLSQPDHEIHEKDKGTLLPQNPPESPKSEASSSHSPSPQPLKTKAIKRKLPNPSTHLKVKPPKKRRLNEKGSASEGEDGGEEGKDREEEEEVENKEEDEEEVEETMHTHLNEDDAPTPPIAATQTTPVLGRSGTKRSKPDPDTAVPTAEEAALIGGPPSKKAKPNPQVIDISSNSSEDDKSEPNASKTNDEIVEVQPTLLASTLDPTDDMYNSFPKSQGSSQRSAGFSHINDNDEEEGFVEGLNKDELEAIGTLDPFNSSKDGNESEEQDETRILADRPLTEGEMDIIQETLQTEDEMLVIPETVQSEDESPQIAGENPTETENESEEIEKEKS